MGGRLIYLMGPSGSGKDSLIDAARDSLAGFDCVVARRVITRSAEAAGESAVSVTLQEFAQRACHGGFALSWNANGLAYGIPVQIDQWLVEGHNVLVNGSRGALAGAREKYPTLLPILLTVDTHVLRKRLERRGRESTEEIAARLERNALFTEGATKDVAQGVFLLDNSGTLADAVVRLLELLRREGLREKSPGRQ